MMPALGKKSPSNSFVFLQRRYCFDPEEFKSQSFDVFEFISACRLNAPLDTIREHLRVYLIELKQQLVSLINRDYADFVYLSSNLIGVDKMALSLERPLTSVSLQLELVYTAVEQSLHLVEAKFAEWNCLKDKHGTLELCLRVADRVELLENLLSSETTIDAPEKSPANGSVAANLTEGVGNAGDMVERSWREDRMGVCDVLERVARGFAPLSVDAMVGAELPFIQSLASRITDIEEELLRRLELVLATEVVPDVMYEHKHHVNPQNLLPCLRAYTIINKADEAERVFSRLVVRPFVEHTFTKGKLDGGGRGRCSGLPALYQRTLQFTREQCGEALLVADEVSKDWNAGNTIPGVVTGSTRSNRYSLRFRTPDLLGRAVWKEVAAALTASDRLGVIFAPGIADTFHANYKCSMQFLEQLPLIPLQLHQQYEKVADAVTTATGAAARFSALPISAAFVEKWNLPVYFQLRVSEVHARLGFVFRHTQQLRVQGEQRTDSEKQQEPTFRLLAARETHMALTRLLRSDVFLGPLGGNFSRLALQLLNRFFSWSKEALLLTPTAGNCGTSSSSCCTESSIATASADVVDTAVGSGGQGATWVATLPDGVLSLAADIATMSTWVKEWYLPRLGELVALPIPKQDLQQQQEQQKLKRCSELLCELFSESILEAREISRHCWGGVRRTMAHSCSQHLAAVKGITATYRMTNKPVPTRPSAFVPALLSPLRELQEKWDFSCPESTPTSLETFSLEAKECARGVCADVCILYTSTVTELTASARLLEDALKKRRRRMDEDGTLSDANKILVQLLLDVREFGTEMRRMGADPDQCEQYERLLQEVKPAEKFIGSEESSV